VSKAVKKQPQKKLLKVTIQTLHGVLLSDINYFGWQSVSSIENTRRWLMLHWCIFTDPNQPFNSAIASQQLA
jgi:hypothetical protein